MSKFTDEVEKVLLQFGGDYVEDKAEAIEQYILSKWVEEISDKWKREFQYLLNGKILSRDEMAYLLGLVNSIINRKISDLKTALGID